MKIDAARLRELASAPGSTLKTICAGLGGISDGSLYGAFKNDPELKRVYDEARASRGAKPARAKASTSTKHRTSSTPPQWSCQVVARSRVAQAAQGGACLH